MSLQIVEQPHGVTVKNEPPLTFYNDPPHRKKFNVTVKLNDSKLKRGLQVRLIYENGNEIVRQKGEDVLIASASNQTTISAGANIALQFGIAHVSFRHQRQKFRLVFECEGCSPVQSDPLLVKAKEPRNNKRKFLSNVMTKVHEVAVKRSKSQEVLAQVHLWYQRSILYCLRDTLC
jgi:hypothetical protein